MLQRLYYFYTPSLSSIPIIAFLWLLPAVHFPGYFPLLPRNLFRGVLYVLIFYLSCFIQNICSISYMKFSSHYNNELV